VEVVASLSQGRAAAAQCGLFTHKSVPVIFETPYTLRWLFRKWDVRTWTGSSWFRIGTNGGHL